MRVVVVSVVLACLLAGCASPRYVPANGSDRDRMETCKGTVVTILDQPGGEYVLTVEPRDADARLLAKGQTAIACPIAADRRDVFAAVLLQVKVGAPVEVSGYWVTATATGLHEILPTSVDPFVGDGR